MLDGIRNWFEVRAAMKDARRLRAGRATVNTVIVEERLRHVQEMIQVGQIDYAAETMEELLVARPLPRGSR